jgi:hypothetical protein
MILTFDIKQEAQAQAVPGPKAIWYDLNKIIVYTGEDIPSDPSPSVS